MAVVVDFECRKGGQALSMARGISQFGFSMHWDKGMGRPESFQEGAWGLGGYKLYSIGQTPIFIFTYKDLLRKKWLGR
jgi:hypothetical protein